MTSLTRSWYGTRVPLESMATVAGTSAEKVLDLKGGKVTAGEVHLDIQDHFYVIQNGTLTDGDILIDRARLRGGDRARRLVGHARPDVSR